MSSFWAVSDDLAPWMVWAAVLLVVATLVLLLVELRRPERRLAVLASGIVAAALLTLAVLRPTTVTVRGSNVGARVLVLFDESRRLELPLDGKTRRERAREATMALLAERHDARFELFGFGDGAPRARTPAELSRAEPQELSDLNAALDSLVGALSEPPAAVVVISDGRLARPQPSAVQATRAGVPVHTLRITDTELDDASIRAVRVAGAAVAHQPLALEIEVGCSGALPCGEVPVRVDELLRGAEPRQLASGVATVKQGTGTLRLDVALEQAGTRVLRVALTAPAGDRVPANDVRLVELAVTRERVRLLHVAGRPTYDVRALRSWLKSDDAVDLVAFFILRTESDDVNAPDSELALIPFPVDELFTEHLPSFDAVIIQDINADEFKLSRHLPALARYVEGGGGLVMVGGPSSFAGGAYAGTDLERVLPVRSGLASKPFDASPFVPAVTASGAEAPLLSSLRELLEGELPEQPGTNLVGAARPDALVLLAHPTLRVGTEPMPVLALGEAADGRAIALTVDGTHRLAFGKVAARAGGRAYGALWDGLLGWLMRDPRYESVRLSIDGGCVTARNARLRIRRPPGAAVDVKLTLEPLAAEGAPRELRLRLDGTDQLVELGRMSAGGWSAAVRLGLAPAVRLDFACEAGGLALADSRPDPARLEAIAKASGGVSLPLSAASRLPTPAPAPLAAERSVRPLLPAWAWTAVAAVALGLHWLLRRRGGLP